MVCDRVLCVPIVQTCELSLYQKCMNIMVCDVSGIPVTELSWKIQRNASAIALAVGRIGLYFFQVGPTLRINSLRICAVQSPCVHAHAVREAAAC